MRLGGQLRVAAPLVLGWDMTAALAFGRALGVCERALAELLPEIEAQMVAKMNEKTKAGSDEHG
jgi:hypothetical protein